MSAEDQTTDSGAIDPPSAEQPSDSTDGTEKDRFRAALERKRAQQHANNAATHNDSKVHGEHARAGTKRTFRRKSG